MKLSFSIWCAAAVALHTVARAATNEVVRVVDTPSVGGRAKDSQRVSLVRDTLGTNGVWKTSHHEYVQLETGLNRRNEAGQWVPVEEEIQSIPAGAQFIGSEHTITFSATPDVSDAVTVVQENGPTLISHVVGLSYYDESSGESVMLATVRESEGMLQSERELLFPDAFEGLEADIRYLITRSSLEQDIVLRSAPPSPSEFGLNPETTRLEVLTEFIESSDPERLAATDPDPKGLDQDLKFGHFQIVSGKAFLGGRKDQSPHAVRKSWQKLSDRQFLIESIPLAGIRETLKTLPSKEGASVAPRSRAKHQTMRPLPPKTRSYQQAKAVRQEPFKVVKKAYAKRSEPAFVMDYVSQIGTTLSNYVFRADQTYYISGTVTLGGTTVFEGGTVIKYPETSSATARLVISSSTASAQFQSGQYRPVIFTAKDDDSIGETISGSTAYPYYSFYANPALSYNTGGSGAALVMNNVSIRYARIGVSVVNNGSAGATPSITHAQFFRCAKGVTAASATLAIRNALFYSDTGSTTAIEATSSSAVTGEHLTVYMDKACSGSSSSFSAKNSIFWVTTVTSGVTYTSNSVALPSTWPFEQVQSGYAYLTASTYQNLGTTNIDAGLAAALKVRTTVAPGDYDSTTGFPSAVLRDTNTPDLGYHYDPIDCIAIYGSNGGASLVSIPSGYAVAAAGGYGFTVNGYTLASSGGPTSRSWLTRHEMVQEGDGSAYGSGLLVDLVADPYGSGASVIDFKFSGLSTLAGGKLFAAAEKTSGISLAHCEVYGGELTDNTTAEFGRTVTLHNDLFVRTKLLFNNQTNGGVKVVSTSSTYDRCAVTLQPVSLNQWSWRNNLFSSSTLTQNAAIIFGANNGYYNPSGVTRITPNSSGDVVLGSHSYSSGTLGGYYISTSSALVNAGDVTADIAGLYHFTTATAQTREGQTKVDIGYHYASLNGSNVPWDTDSDGIPDCIEDVSGAAHLNATAVSGGNGPTQGYKVFITRPRNGENRP